MKIVGAWESFFCPFSLTLFVSFWEQRHEKSRASLELWGVRVSGNRYAHGGRSRRSGDGSQVAVWFIRFIRVTQVGIHLYTLKSRIVGEGDGFECGLARIPSIGVRLVTSPS